MRDVSIDELAEEIRDVLIDQGVNISRDTARILTREFFSSVEKIILEKPDVRFSMYNRDITHVFYPVDKKKLCDEFAAGEGVSYDNLLRKNKLTPQARKFLKQRIGNTMSDKALK